MSFTKAYYQCNFLLYDQRKPKRLLFTCITNKSHAVYCSSKDLPGFYLQEKHIFLVILIEVGKLPQSLGNIGSTTVQISFSLYMGLLHVYDYISYLNTSLCLESAHKTDYNHSWLAAHKRLQVPCCNGFHKPCMTNDLGSNFSSYSLCLI